MGRVRHADAKDVRKEGGAAATATPPPQAAAVDPAEVYQRVIEYEEQEAARRPPEADAELFFATCESLRGLFKRVADVKGGNNNNSEELRRARNEAAVHVVTLRKLNRLEKIRTKAGRDALHREKQKLDSMHLLLQNLLYEAKHLDREAARCLQFKSKDEEIDLIDVDDFYKSAPKDVSRPSVTKNNEHQLRLARLEWELRQRRELSEACSQLQDKSRTVSSTLSEARSRLAGLAPKLHDALVAAEPLREALDIPMSKMGRVTQEPATLLPSPLFLLYARTLTFSEAFEQFTVNVSIVGDEGEARQVQENHMDLPAMSDSDSDTEGKDEEDNQDKKKRHRRSGTKLTKKEKAEERIKLVIKAHPLKVTIRITVKECTLVLTFVYLVNLKIVTVESSMETSKQISGVSSGDVLNSQNILHSLYPNDDGSDSPHPATVHILQSAGVDLRFPQFISELGRPYVWAQRMCGLDFMAFDLSEFQEKSTVAQLPNEPSPKLSGATVENVIIELNKHLKRRLRLTGELQELESGNLPPFEGTGSSNVRLMGSLTQWQAISWAEYNQAASAAHLIAIGLISPNDMFYRAIITRQSAKLVALVALKSDYPKRAPIFSLTLHWNGTHHSRNDDDIRDIERCVNTNDDDGKKRVTLGGQITRVIACLDVLLEAMGGSEFPPDKVMFAPVRGRTRTKPYKFLKQGSGVFIQY